MTDVTSVDDTRLTRYDRGPPDAPLVVLVHGLGPVRRVVPDSGPVVVVAHGPGGGILLAHVYDSGDERITRAVLAASGGSGGPPTPRGWGVVVEVEKARWGRDTSRATRSDGGGRQEHPSPLSTPPPHDRPRRGARPDPDRSGYGRLPGGGASSVSAPYSPGRRSRRYVVSRRDAASAPRSRSARRSS